MGKLIKIYFACLLTAFVDGTDDCQTETSPLGIGGNNDTTTTGKRDLRFENQDRLNCFGA